MENVWIKQNDPGSSPWVAFELLMSLGYFCDLSSAATGVRMHIVHMHIAMVVMRIVSSIVLPLYKTSRAAVKPGPELLYIPVMPRSGTNAAAKTARAALRIKFPPALADQP